MQTESSSEGDTKCVSKATTKQPFVQLDLYRLLYKKKSSLPFSTELFIQDYKSTFVYTASLYAAKVCTNTAKYRKICTNTPTSPNKDISEQDFIDL